MPLTSTSISSRNKCYRGFCPLYLTSSFLFSITFPVFIIRAKSIIIQLPSCRVRLSLHLTKIRFTLECPRLLERIGLALFSKIKERFFKMVNPGYQFNHIDYDRSGTLLAGAQVLQPISTRSTKNVGYVQTGTGLVT